MRNRRALVFPMLQKRPLPFCLVSVTGHVKIDSVKYMLELYHLF